MQRVDAKVQSALDMKKQNLKDETKKRKELVKSMEEVNDENICVHLCKHEYFKPFLFCLGQENANRERK